MKLTRCLLCFLWPLFEGSSVLYGQTVTEALDTPGISWVITGSAQPLADSLLSHDGVDFLKLSHLPGVPSKVSAQFPSPSEVKFWHRSADPARVSFFRVGDLAGPSLPVSSTDWQEHRLVVLPGTFALEFAGTSVAPAIHLDQLSLTALTEIGLSEALDAPGLSFSRAGSNRLPAGLAVSGVTAEADAVYFPDSGSSSVTTTVTGPAVLKYRYFPVPASEHPLQPPVFGAQKPDSSQLHQWRLGGTGLVCVPGGSQAVELYRSGGTVDVSSVILDQVEVLPMLSLSEALDAPELTFTTTNATDDAGPRIAPVAAGPPEAEGGDALLLIGSFSGNPPAVKTSLSGPGVLIWNRLGLGVVEVDDVPMIPRFWVSCEYSALSLDGLCANRLRRARHRLEAGTFPWQSTVLA